MEFALALALAELIHPGTLIRPGTFTLLVLPLTRGLLLRALVYLFPFFDRLTSLLFALAPRVFAGFPLPLLLAVHFLACATVFFEDVNGALDVTSYALGYCGSFVAAEAH